MGHIGSVRSGVHNNRHSERQVSQQEVKAHKHSIEMEIEAMTEEYEQDARAGKLNVPPQRRHRDVAPDLIKKYDKIGHGVLNRKQISRLLADLSAASATVSEDELDFVFKVADPRGDGFISAHEMCTVLNCWENYQSSLEEIEIHFLRHDPECTGRLDKEQLYSLLAELAGPRQVTRADVNWVMRQADTLKNGVITKPELRRALALWESHLKALNNACCTMQ